ncbi:MAG: LacI family DNA-binding transcriptional regulator [Bryobacteraceae bacterium]|nr:LacI family DNA-binding transcriptional regulator [Bryobacteraceae bacterium]
MSLEDVARRARVSTATVSRVLNGVDVVKPTTRARVMKAVSELKYHPNLHARSLAGGRNKTLGVIVSNLENPFFLDVYRSLEADCHDHGFEVLVANTDYRAEQLVASIRLMIGRRVAGLAVIVSEMENVLVQELIDSEIPVVFYDVGPSTRNITNIRVNYRKGVERVVDYLMALGHRKLAFVGHHSSLGPINERYRAVLDVLARMAPDAEIREAADTDSLEGGRQAARSILSSGYAPTAIICVNDLMAVGVLKELRESGLRVPEDVSVTGFDNIGLSEFCCPSLTTVHIPRDRIGHILFSILSPEEKDSAGEGKEIVIDPEFMVRESTGPANQRKPSAPAKVREAAANRPA